MQKFCSFNWDESEDEENKEEEEEKISNFENIIEETLENMVNNGGSKEIGLIKKLLSKQKDSKEHQNEEVVQHIWKKLKSCGTEMKWSAF